MNYATAIPQSIIDRVLAKIDETVARASAYYNHKFEAITDVRFDKKGRVAGTATYYTRMVNFNKVLLLENVEAFITRTVPHEVVHVLSNDLFGRDGQGHGRLWKQMMVVVGADPSRCHSYDTSNSQVKKKNKFHYQCSCGSDITVSSVIHNRVRSGAGYRCKKCGTSLHDMPWRKLGQVTYTEAASARTNSNKEFNMSFNDARNNRKPVEVVYNSKPAATKVAKKGSKKELAIDLYRGFLSIRSRIPTRQELVSLFVRELDMTPAGASTYASNVKNWI